MKSTLACLAVLALLPTACASTALRRFPLREPLLQDPDLSAVAFPCHPDPKKKGAQVCTPEPYDSSFAWDAADNTVFRPLSRFFAVDPAGEAVNVNSLDETPDSSWFTNRIGSRFMSPAEVEQGACDPKQVLDIDGPDGSWLIDQGKMNGANPGFRVVSRGFRFMLKSDPPEQPERATGATVIATHFYHAAGYWVPCEKVVYLKRSLLKLKPGLSVTDNSGTTRSFDENALDELLKNASRRGPLIRMVASQWLPGRPLGPYKYDGLREDDPNDLVPHEDRRDLRGARLIAAWLNHFDSREQNTMTTWMAANQESPASSPGHLRHWYLDLGDCFGSEWEWEEISRRLGHAYYLDIPYLLEDFATLGIINRPWDKASRSSDGDIFGFFHSRDFEPDKWKGGYPNPAFARMSERDGAWAARIIARFSPAHVEAALRTGDYTKPEHRRFLLTHLLIRQRAILRRYLSKLSPITDLKIQGDGLCGTDLARLNHIADPSSFRYSAALYSGNGLSGPRIPLRIREDDQARICVGLPHLDLPETLPRESAARYMLLDLSNGQAKGPLRIHLYDLGKDGFQLAGVERPEEN